MITIQRIALVIIGCGILTMLGFFIESLISDSDLPIGFVVGITVVMVGSCILLISVALDRYRAWKGEEDDFKGVKY